MIVNLVYYKKNGKFYSDESYETKRLWMYEIFEEVQEKLDNRRLPGLVNNHSPYFVTVDVPEHEHNHPGLCIPKVWNLGEGNES